MKIPDFHRFSRTKPESGLAGPFFARLFRTLRAYFLLAFLIVILIFFDLQSVCSQNSEDRNQIEGQVQQPPQVNDPCAECHVRITPGIVVDWQLSKHSANDIGCAGCHGDRHNSMTDSAKAGFAGPEVCARYHGLQVEQFGNGKHALAWGAMKAMPSFHLESTAYLEGFKGCVPCHRIGLKTQGEVKDLIEKNSGFGVSSCDMCHTRHLFSLDEAKSPQACRTCHTGTDHPQWEMYESSKHGVRFLLKQSRMLPEDAAAPTCQSCHFPDGDHNNRTAWGFLALRFPYPRDEEWARDRLVIMQALGIFDPDGKTTARMAAFEGNKLIGFSQKEWETQREKDLKVCNDCHSINFARAELEKGDRIIREADALMAEGIRIVSALYQDGLLKKPDYYSYAFPDFLSINSAPTVIEQKLYSMFHEYRMRTFQGAFHSSPGFSFWNGWAPLQNGLAEIRERASDIRRTAQKKEDQIDKDNK